MVLDAMILFAFFISVISYAAPLSLPTCVRPKDFSNGKFVASYEACRTRQRDFCSAHPEVTTCDRLNSPGKPYFKVTVDDIDPTKRCWILKDGSYKCLQDPIRIMTASNEQGTAPAPGASPGASATPAFKMPDEDNGGAAPDSTPVFAPLKPPPPKN